MPTEIYIAVLVACSCVVILTVLLLVTMIYLKVKVDAMEKSVTLIKSDLLELIRESRVVVEEVRLTIARVSKPMEDIEHITQAARQWTDRTGRLIDAVETIAEPPLFFLSNKFKTVSGILSVVLQMLLNPKRE